MRPSSPSIRWARWSSTRHDVVDADLVRRIDTEIRQAAIGLGVQLVVVADDEIDLGHGGEGGGLGLRGAAGDDDAGIRVFAPRLADRLARLAHGFAGHRAGVDDDGAAGSCPRPASVCAIAHDLGFEGIEPAAESHDVDAAYRPRRS